MEVKKELTSKLAELMYPQWMEGTAESCSLDLLTPCQIVIQVSWARAHSRHSLLRVNFSAQHLCLCICSVVGGLKGRRCVGIAAV